MSVTTPTSATSGFLPFLIVRTERSRQFPYSVFKKGLLVLLLALYETIKS